MKEYPFNHGVVTLDADDILEQTNQSILEYHRKFGTYFHKIVSTFEMRGGHPMGLRKSTEVYSDDVELPPGAVIESEYAEGELVGSQGGHNGYHTHGPDDGSINKIPVVWRKDI